MHEVALVGTIADHHARFNGSKRRSLLLGNIEFSLDDRIGVEHPVDRLEQRVDSLSRACRNKDLGSRE